MLLKSDILVFLFQWNIIQLKKFYFKEDIVIGREIR